jgi:hypothetical protein
VGIVEFDIHMTPGMKRFPISYANRSIQFRIGRREALTCTLVHHTKKGPT